MTAWDPQECWEEPAETTKWPRPNANLCVTFVKCDIKQWNVTSLSSASVSLSGAALLNARCAQRDIL